MSRKQTEQNKRLYSPEYPFNPISQSSTMLDQQDAASTSSQSSDSIGSRTGEEKAEDRVFDKIEDVLSDLMRNPSPQHLSSRVFQWPLSGDPSRTLTATILISPVITKN
jgi:hypothetical protein